MDTRNGMEPVHPGEILRGEMDELDLSANALAVQNHRDTVHWNGQRLRERGVTADTALRLARYSVRPRSCGSTSRRRGSFAAPKSERDRR